MNEIKLKNKTGQAIPSHIYVFFTNTKECKDMFDKLIKEKWEHHYHINGYKEVFFLPTKIGTKYFNFLLKQKSQNFIGCSFKFYLELY